MKMSFGLPLPDQATIQPPCLESRQLCLEPLLVFTTTKPSQTLTCRSPLPKSLTRIILGSHAGSIASVDPDNFSDKFLIRRIALSDTTNFIQGIAINLT